MINDLSLRIDQGSQCGYELGGFTAARIPAPNKISESVDFFPWRLQEKIFSYIHILIVQ